MDKPMDRKIMDKKMDGHKNPTEGKTTDKNRGKTQQT